MDNRYKEAWDSLYECFDEETQEGWEMQELMRQILVFLHYKEVKQ